MSPSAQTDTPPGDSPGHRVSRAAQVQPGQVVRFRG